MHDYTVSYWQMLFPAKLTWKVLWLLTQVGLLLLPQLRRKLHSAVHLRTTRLTVHAHLSCQGKNQDSNECDTSQLVRLSFERRWLLEVLQFESQPFSFLVKSFFLSFAFRVSLWVRVRARVRLAFDFCSVFCMNINKPWILWISFWAVWTSANPRVEHCSANYLFV